jgi:hypothetical protein
MTPSRVRKVCRVSRIVVVSFAQARVSVTVSDGLEPPDSSHDVGIDGYPAPPEPPGFLRETSQLTAFPAA